MGCRDQSNYDDPPRFHKKGKVWCHVSGTKPRLWTRLSSDRAEALRLWAQRESVPEDDSTKLFSVVAKRYVREIFPSKSIQTRKDNDKELANLLKVFAHMPIDVIAPMHVREYIDIRGQAANVSANREKACFPTSLVKRGNGDTRLPKTHAKESRALRKPDVPGTSPLQNSIKSRRTPISPRLTQWT